MGSDTLSTLLFFREAFVSTGPKERLCAMVSERVVGDIEVACKPSSPKPLAEAAAAASYSAASLL